VKLELAYSTKSGLYSLIISHGLWYAVKLCIPTFVYDALILTAIRFYNWSILLFCSLTFCFFLDFQIFYSKRVARVLHSVPIFLFFVMSFTRGWSNSCVATLCDFVKGKSVNGYYCSLLLIRCILIGPPC